MLTNLKLNQWLTDRKNGRKKSNESMIQIKEDWLSVYDVLTQNLHIPKFNINAATIIKLRERFVFE